MTTEQFQQLDRRFDMLVGFLGEKFDSIDKRFEAVDQRFETIDVRLNNVENQLDSLTQTVKALDLKIDDVREEVIGFASDTYDRLSNRIESVATFVGAPRSSAIDSSQSES